MSVTVVDLREQIAGALHLDGAASLSGFWSAIAPWALEQARTDRLSILAMRGFTATQINSWSGADSFDLTQGTFWALTKGAGMEEVDYEATKQLDLRKWLEESATILDAAGNVISGVSRVGHGLMNGSYKDALARDYQPSRRGIIDPGTGRLRDF